jgi:hypothetical protein
MGSQRYPHLHYPRQDCLRAHPSVQAIAPPKYPEPPDQVSRRRTLGCEGYEGVSHRVSTAQSEYVTHPG